MLPVSPAGRRYGVYRDNPLHPARTLLRLSVPADIQLPPKASTSQWMGRIRDQGQEGSCTGQMGSALRDALYRKLYIFEKDKSVVPSALSVSASFVYKCNLIADGDLGTDAGSSIHQTFITLNQKGACLEALEPYSDNDYSAPPSAAQYAGGLTYRGGSYHFLPDLITMKACIASGYPLGFGISVYSSFEDSWSVAGQMPMPDVKTEQLLGGHAQPVFDYDDDLVFADGYKGGLLIQNSWGTNWGVSAPGRTDGGCYWMPYAYVEAGLANDAWMMHLGRPW